MAARQLWVQKSDIGPTARRFHSMAFDSSRQCTVLFGGSSSKEASFGDTWEWDGFSWTQVADQGPSIRMGHAMAFDNNRNKTVLYGGFVKSGAPVLNDTWEWDGSNWTQVAETGPSDRAFSSMAFDTLAKHCLLFGGDSGDIVPGELNDTWSWDGNQWLQLGEIGPPPRYEHALAYDNVRKCSVMYGGTNDAGIAFGDTWEWDGALWHEVINFGPDKMSDHAMDFNGNNIILFAGNTATGVQLQYTWLWDGNHWTKELDIGPSSRSSHKMSFDSIRNCIVLFGGSVYNTGVFTCQGDTWELITA